MNRPRHSNMGTDVIDTIVFVWWYQNRLVRGLSLDKNQLRRALHDARTSLFMFLREFTPFQRHGSFI
jgi:hypothetical protein